MEKIVAEMGAKTSPILSKGERNGEDGCGDGCENLTYPSAKGGKRNGEDESGAGCEKAI